MYKRQVQVAREGPGVLTPTTGRRRFTAQARGEPRNPPLGVLAAHVDLVRGEPRLAAYDNLLAGLLLDLTEQRTPGVEDLSLIHI